MGNSDKQEIKKALLQITEDKKSDELILQALHLLKPSQRRIIFLIAFYILSVIFFIFFVNNSNAKENTLIIVDIVNMVSIPILALAITGFSIFQALANRNTLINLLKVQEGELNKFQEYNLFFMGFSILYLVIIIFNVILKFTVGNLHDVSQIPFFSTETNTIIYTLALNLYIGIILFSLIEIKSFIYNLYTIFSINAVSEGLEYLHEQNSDE